MTDTEIIDWMQENVVGIYENLDTSMSVTWLDRKGVPRETSGSNLRDCVRAAYGEEVIIAAFQLKQG